MCARVNRDRVQSVHEIKPLTVCFWSDFAANPAVMYELFAPNPRHLDYNPDKVKVMGTADGMIKSVAYLRRCGLVSNYCDQLFCVCPQ